MPSLHVHSSFDRERPGRGICLLSGNRHRGMSKELRLYRSYLFGKRNAEDAKVNDVRYDEDGWAWLKTDTRGTPWINSHPDNQGLEWSNDTMDENDEHTDSIPIKGIFETKRVLTSELIPYLLQSIRAFECRLDTLCRVAILSVSKSGEDPVELPGGLQELGCIRFEDLESYPECHLEYPVIDEADAATYCTAMADQLLRREVELLKLAVEYDAGYRSLLQFAGNFDIFLREMRWPLAGTLRQAVQLIGQLERIPCFLSSCDASPPPYR